MLAPEEVSALPDGSFDLIICNSVAQYLSRDLLASLVLEWRRLLAPGGRLLIADVIPPHVSALADAQALLRLAAREKFLLAAVAGLARTAISPYRKLRAELGLTTYEEAEVLASAGPRPASRRGGSSPMSATTSSAWPSSANAAPEARAAPERRQRSKPARRLSVDSAASPRGA